MPCCCWRWCTGPALTLTCAAAPANPTPPNPGRAAAVLGLGSYSQRELFSIYVELQLLCYCDRG